MAQGSLDRVALETKPGWGKMACLFSREQLNWLLKITSSPDLPDPSLVYAIEEKNIWLNLRKINRDKMTDKFITSFDKIIDSQRSLWEDIEKILTKKKLFLEGNREKITLINRIIGQLLGSVDNKEPNINTYLIINWQQLDEWAAWFSSKGRDQSMIVECPINKNNSNNLLLPLAVICHEIFHLKLRRQKKLLGYIKKVAQNNSNLLNKIGYKTSNPAMVLEELVISSFIPEGYLGKKYFNLSFGGNPKRSLQQAIDILDFVDTRRRVARQIFDMSKIYVDIKMAIDKNYVDYLMQLLKKERDT